MPRALVPAAILAVALAIAAVGYPVLFPSPERRIHRALDDLVRTLNTRAEGIDAMAKAAKIGRAFTDGATVDFGDGPPVHGRDQVMAIAARLQDRARLLHIALEDMDVSVAADKASADVSVTVTATSDDSTDAREFQLRLVKSRDAWLIERATGVHVLRK